MKSLIFLILLFLVNSVHALSLQFGTGGLTPHFGRSKKNYCNQWNDTGIIVNKSYYLRVYEGQFGFTYLQGNDSICSDIEGVFFHYMFSADEWIEYAITVGGYAYNQNNWKKHAAKTPSSIDAPHPLRAKYFGRDIVPVLGLDVAIHLIRRKNWSLKLNNLLTPVIFNHSVSWEYRFY